MSGSTFGDKFKIHTFGESYSRALGVLIDNIKPGIKISRKIIQKELFRRRPRQSRFTTQRKEKDRIEILSGIFSGKTTGAPICIIVRNKSKVNGAYKKMKNLFRPGHADFTYFKKYQIRDYRGGGRASARETISRVIAGAIAKKLLEERGIKITGFTRSIAGVTCRKVDYNFIEKNPFRCCDKTTASRIKEVVGRAIKNRDSVGGIVEVHIKNISTGLGEPVFEKLDAELAKAIVSIGAVKGVEFGSGFSSTKKFGSENNDQINKSGFITNNAGGILGGISTGQDIIIRAAVKPTSSIGKKQKTIDIFGEEKTIRITGNHDPCICPRIVPVIEAMCAIVLYDFLLKQKDIAMNDEGDLEKLRKALDDIDENVLFSLKNREGIVKLISRYKKLNKIPIYDRKREKELFAGLAKVSKTIGLNKNFTRRIFQFILNNAKKIQRRCYVDEIFEPKRYFQK
jgi:chorismate synthase